MKLQKLVVVMAALAGGIGSGAASALGLGEVKLYSALNQPLVAEIELLQVKDLTRNEVLSNLASRADFERAGVERPFSLTHLNFKTEVRPDGKGVIKVSSSKPVHEPYLNFLVEVHWPSGRLLREYTLLLDPPSFNEQIPGQVVAPKTNASSSQSYSVYDESSAARDYLPAPEPERRTAYDRQERPVRKLSPSSSSYPSSARGETYTVRRNDSLWEIAERVRPGRDVTVQQTMLAIQRGNPQAFIDNNINRIKRGQVLRVPAREEINRLTVREAIADVARQNREWRDQRRVVQLDATRRSSARKETESRPVDGKLAIVADSGSSGDGQDLGGGNAQANAALQTELAMTREQLDQFARENAELKSRLKDLDEQVATLKRLITLKDDQMAALQNQTADAPAARPQPVEKPAVKPIAPAPVQEKGFFDWLFNNPLLLLLGVIPIALAGLILHRRRNRQEAEVDDEADITPLDLVSDSDGDSADAAGLPGEEEFQFDEALEIDDALLDEASGEAVAQQTEDALSEADIYIAYGRFNQAADLLDKAIEAEPQRSDLRLKLLEVHGENNDLDKFKEALAGLEATGDQGAIREADAFKSRFPGAFETGGGEADDLGLWDLDPNEQQDSDLGDLDFDLDDLYEEDEKASSASAPAEANEQEEELDFDLDDLDLDLDLDLDPAAQDSQAAFSGEGGSSLEASINDDDLDLLTEDDEVATKLDLARAYMDMGDMEGARGILEEVVEQGSEEQKQEARALMENAG